MAHEKLIKLCTSVRVFAVVGWCWSNDDLLAGGCMWLTCDFEPQTQSLTHTPPLVLYSNTVSSCYSIIHCSLSLLYCQDYHNTVAIIFHPFCPLCGHGPLLNFNYFFFSTSLHWDRRPASCLFLKFSTTARLTATGHILSTDVICFIS